MRPQPSVFFLQLQDNFHLTIALICRGLQQTSVDSKLWGYIHSPECPTPSAGGCCGLPSTQSSGDTFTPPSVPPLLQGAAADFRRLKAGDGQFWDSRASLVVALAAAGGDGNGAAELEWADLCRPAVAPLPSNKAKMLLSRFAWKGTKIFLASIGYSHIGNQVLTTHNPAHGPWWSVYAQCNVD